MAEIDPEAYDKLRPEHRNTINLTLLHETFLRTTTMPGFRDIPLLDSLNYDDPNQEFVSNPDIYLANMRDTLATAVMTSDNMHEVVNQFAPESRYKGLPDSPDDVTLVADFFVINALAILDTARDDQGNVDHSTLLENSRVIVKQLGTGYNLNALRNGEIPVVVHAGFTSAPQENGIGCDVQAIDMNEITSQVATPIDKITECISKNRG